MSTRLIRGRNSWFGAGTRAIVYRAVLIKVRPRAEWRVTLNTHEAMITAVQAKLILSRRAIKSAM
jgi:hypothetical protein